MRETIGGQTARIVQHDQDRYGRTIGDIYHDDTLINLSLVKADLAWHYVKYAPDNTALREAEQQACELLETCGFEAALSHPHQLPNVNIISVGELA